MRATCPVTVDLITRLRCRLHTCGGQPHGAPVGCFTVGPPCLPNAGTDRTPPVNPIFEYAVDVLGLRLQPKHRDGPGATALYDRWGLWG